MRFFNLGEIKLKRKRKKMDKSINFLKEHINYYENIITQCIYKIETSQIEMERWQNLLDVLEIIKKKDKDYE